MKEYKQIYFLKGIPTVCFLKGIALYNKLKGIALKETNSWDSLKEIICIFLNKTHDIKFIMQHKDYNYKKYYIL